MNREKEPFVDAEQVIPEMTHPLSKHWDQPARKGIMISPQRAMVPKKVFEALHEYSATNPTGVYEGKMWKRNKWIPAGHGSHKMTNIWYLCWYGGSDHPDKCSINTRLIV